MTQGRFANAVCDRCGRHVKYTEIYAQIENRKPNGLKVCGDCLDQDNPQLWVGEMKVVDMQSLHDPRSDSAENLASRSLFDWNPVLGRAGTGSLGIVRVTTT